MDIKYEGNTLLKKLISEGVPLKVVEDRIKSYESTVAGLELCGKEVESIHFEDFFRDLLPVVDSKGMAYDAIERAKAIKRTERVRRKNAKEVIKQLKAKLGN